MTNSNAQPPSSALRWLLIRGAVNRTVRRARRARQPRYAIAIIVGLAYFWFVIGPRRQTGFRMTGIGTTAHQVYALLFALLTLSWWLFGSDEAALSFSSAEVQLLFPAPLTRRQVVAYKLLQAQTMILPSVVLSLVFLSRASGSIPERAVSLWVIYTTLYLHRVAASLVRESAAEHGASGLKRHIGAIVIVAAVVAAVVWGVAAQIPLLRAAIASGNKLGAATAVLDSPTSRAVLYPFRLVLAPAFAASTGAWVRAVWPAIVIVVAHVVWVLHIDAAFEEAAAASAARRAVVLARRAGRASMPAARGLRRRFRLPLPVRSTAAGAIVWKNIVALGRTLAMRTVIAITIAVTITLFAFNSVLPETDSLAVIAGRLCLVLTGILLMLGPIWVRNDLRLDMPQLELLRSFPLGGASLVRAELCAALVTLGALQVPLLLLAFALNPIHNKIVQSWSDQTALLATSLIVIPSVSALGVMVQNAAALLFPAFTRFGLVRPGGIEAIGQGIVTMFGSFVVLTLGLLLPLALGGAVSVVAVSAFGLWGLLPGTVLGAAVVFGELWLVTAWLGRVFERTDEVPDETAVAAA